MRKSYMTVLKKKTIYSTLYLYLTYCDIKVIQKLSTNMLFLHRCFNKCIERVIINPNIQLMHKFINFHLCILLFSLNEFNNGISIIFYKDTNISKTKFQNIY